MMLVSDKVYGIDLGTTNSCIAYAGEKGVPVIIKNAEGRNKTPSVISYADAPHIQVGDSAKELVSYDPENAIVCVKKLMGKKKYAFSYFDEKITPEELSAMILRKMVQDAEKTENRMVEDVVITCPAYFGDAEREATRRAGQIAGLNVLDIINEPTAAAIYYGCMSSDMNEKTILVYDLGGGTFDVTVMHIDSLAITVVCSDGSEELGGTLWDKKLAEMIKNKFDAAIGSRLCVTKEIYLELMMQAEAMKIHLSDKMAEKKKIQIDSQTAFVEISREDFERQTAPLLEQTIKITDQAIRVAATKGYQVDEIFMSGGSTRMPQVSSALEQYFGRKPRVLEPDEAVAKGAAVYAAAVYGHGSDNMKKIVDTTWKDVRKVIFSTTKSYAVEVDHNGQHVCRNLIVKNTTMRDGFVKGKIAVGTEEDNMDSVDLVVYENDSMNQYLPISEARQLGVINIKLPEHHKSNDPIVICFTLNHEGILRVSAGDRKEHLIMETQLQALGIMEDEEMVRIREKASEIMIQ